MKKQLGNILLALALVFPVIFVIFVINQTASIVILAKEYNPFFGSILLYGLLLLYAAIVAFGIITFLKMPSALRPPGDENSPEFEKYLEKLKRNLARNNYVAGSGVPLETRSDLEKVVALLNVKADELIKSTASTVFVSTAISQNGRLDVIMVLLAQVRLIRELAHIYNQHPSIREIIDLYLKVAATAFSVGSVEELDLEEQIEPIITPLISGSVIGGVPGTGGLATYMTTSIVEGAANALLTLRVGIITRGYFGIKSGSDTRQLRRLASREAGNMLAPIVAESASYVTGVIIKASKKRAGAVGSTLKDKAIKSTKKITDVSRKSAQAVFDSLKKPKK